MQLEFHQLDQRWEHLGVRQPHLQRGLLASLADAGQQTPIIVVAAPDDGARYLVIDGHKRIAALRQLGRDTVEAAVWAMSEAEALLNNAGLRRFTPNNPKNGSSSPSTATGTHVDVAAGCLAQSPIGRSAEQLRGTVKLDLPRCSGVPNRRV